MIAESRFSIDRDPRVYAATAAPAHHEWAGLWSAWDLVTRSMIPEKELLSKPIHLRNCCIFYLGHIPAFLDRQVSCGTDGTLTEPTYFAKLFERGIDPDVENPELCHAHSEIPDEWPSLSAILQYQEDVRDRVRALYCDGTLNDDRRIARSLWLGFEHEVMHLETLLYMLLQSDWIRPPPGPQPDFAALAAAARQQGNEASWISIPTQTIKLGIDDPENDEGPDRYFGWDNEKPSRKVHVPGFVASTRAITNGEFARYLESCGVKQWPVSWVVSESSSNKNGLEAIASNGTYPDGDTVPIHSNNGHTSTGIPFTQGKSVRTVYGPIPLEFALDWPMMASYDELAGCAQWMGGRIPTHPEAQSIYEYVSVLDSKSSLSNDARTIPAVNGHLSNDGVEETPPSCKGSSLDPRSLFADLEDANVGFRAFHPLPAVLCSKDSSRLAGQAGLGGVWEWTSSELTSHEGFEPMGSYPAYTADFFDGKHNIVLGGSWATHPKIAGRRSFVNWYQRNYPYAWCGARLVRDLPH